MDGDVGIEVEVEVNGGAKRGGVTPVVRDDDAVRKVCTELGEVIFVLQHRDPGAPVPQWLIQRLNLYRVALEGALSGVKAD